MPPTPKTYTNLMEARSTGYFDKKFEIKRCEAILPNRMQCWRGADFHVTEVIPATTTADGAEVAERTVEYQFCKQHVNIQKGEDLELQKKEEADALKAKQDAEASWPTEEQKTALAPNPSTTGSQPPISGDSQPSTPSDTSSVHDQMKETLNPTPTA
jgi:hypothetical protein